MTAPPPHPTPPTYPGQPTQPTQPTGPPVRVLVVDDHPVVRAGMVAILSEQPGIEVIGAAADGAQALALARQLAPDLVLMDLRMPVLDGVGATSRLRAEPDAPEVLVLTTYDTDAEILHAVEAGARGYLLKDTPPDVLADAIRRAAAGETVLAPRVAARLADRLRAPAGPELTPREVDVLTLVAKGLSNSEIGRALHIGEATVKTHLLRVFAKLDVADRTAAVTAAYGHRLIPLPDDGAR
jgi:DNA-binding NarL/FixJ family response regulator